MKLKIVAFMAGQNLKLLEVGMGLCYSARCRHCMGNSWLKYQTLQEPAEGGQFGVQFELDAVSVVWQPAINSQLMITGLPATQHTSPPKMQ